MGLVCTIWRFKTEPIENNRGQKLLKYNALEKLTSQPSLKWVLLKKEGGLTLRHPLVVCVEFRLLYFSALLFFLLKMLLPWDITDIISTRISWCWPRISSLWPKRWGGGGLYPAIEEQVRCGCWLPRGQDIRKLPSEKNSRKVYFGLKNYLVITDICSSSHSNQTSSAPDCWLCSTAGLLLPCSPCMLLCSPCPDPCVWPPHPFAVTFNPQHARLGHTGLGKEVFASTGTDDDLLNILKRPRFLLVLIVSALPGLLHCK